MFKKLFTLNSFENAVIFLSKCKASMKSLVTFKKSGL